MFTLYCMLFLVMTLSVVSFSKGTIALRLNQVVLIATENIKVCDPIPCHERNISNNIGDGLMCCQCSCESSCVVDKTCCTDNLEQLEPILTLQPKARERTEQCTMPVAIGQHVGVVPSWMVSRCPADFSGDSRPCEVASYMEVLESGDYDNGLPVNDVIESKIYRNKYCAHCNGANDGSLISWRPVVWGLFHNIIVSKDTILDGIKRQSIVMAFVNPTNSIASFCPIDGCNVTGLWTQYDEFTEVACLSYMSVLVTANGQRYKNYYCALCNGEIISEAYQCLDNQHLIEPFTAGVQTMSKAYLNTDLMRLGEITRRPDDQESSKCAADHVYDPVIDTCIKMYCSSALQLVHGVCEQKFVFLDSVLYRLRFRHVAVNYVPMAVYVQNELKTSINSMLKRLNIRNIELVSLMQTYTVDVSYIQFERSFNISNTDIKHVISEIVLVVKQSPWHNLPSTETIFREVSVLYDTDLFDTSMFKSTPFLPIQTSSSDNDKWSEEELQKALTLYMMAQLPSEEKHAEAAQQNVVPHLFELSFFGSSSVAPQTFVQPHFTTSGSAMPTSTSRMSTLSETVTTEPSETTTKPTEAVENESQSSDIHVTHNKPSTESITNFDPADVNGTAFDASTSTVATEQTPTKGTSGHRRVMYRQDVSFGGIEHSFDATDAFILDLNRKYSCPKVRLQNVEGVYNLQDRGLAIATTGVVVIPVEKIIEEAADGDVVVCVEDYLDSHIHQRHRNDERNTAVKATSAMSWLCLICYGFYLGGFY